MSMELDYVARENFEFFSYRNELKDEKKALFLSRCQGVLEAAHATMDSTFRMALKIEELHSSHEWHEVIDPLTGECFIYSSFGAFCKYAFGFSETKTSNLETVASFLKLTADGTVAFRQPEYEGYGYSQLIELNQIPFYSRKLVNPSMSVSDLRLVRKYMETPDYATDWKGSQYNVLSRAQEYERRKAAEAEERRRIKEQAQAYQKDTLPGQIDVTSLLDKNSDVGTADAGGKMEEVKEPISEELRSEFLKLFKTRDGRREFLSRYDEWKSLPMVELLDEDVFEYVFRDGTKIYAVASGLLTDLEPYLRFSEDTRYYILTEPFGSMPLQVSKRMLEEWMAKHVDEL